MANSQGILKNSLFFAIPGNALFFSVTSVLSVAGAISRFNATAPVTAICSAGDACATAVSAVA